MHGEDLVASQRPALTRELTGQELMRWYWLREELAVFARGLGVRASGSKQLLTQRLAAALDGEPFTEPARRRTGNGTQLSGPLEAETVIPPGQRCSQHIRQWFVQQVGDRFRFDEPMRAFFAAADGTHTLQDALDHYLASRDRGASDIEPQLEYNRFTRAWHEQHPEGTRGELMSAWREYRSQPVDQRGRV